MNLTIRVTFISRVTDALVETDTFGTLRCTDRDILRDLSYYSNSKLPASVAFDEEGGRIASVYSAPTDLIVALSPWTSFEPQIAVHLQTQPTVLYLSKSNPRFKFLHGVLQAALAHQSQVHIGVLPPDVIEDVRTKDPAPLSGPDFVLDQVASWVEKEAELVLRDGSTWKLEPGEEMYEVYCDTITRAVAWDKHIFVSGDKSRGLVEVVLYTTRWAVQEIGSQEINARYSVVFQGPARIFHLRTDRPWSSEALSLLRTSLNSGASFTSPDLIVATDPRNSEIVAVKPIVSTKPDAAR